VQCEPFIWGGCKGNKNRYSSKDDCEKKCSGTLNMTLSLILQKCLCKILFILVETSPAGQDILSAGKYKIKALIKI